MRKAARTDRNQIDIVEALRSMGAMVQPLHTVGQGVPDLLVGMGGRLMLIEVKDGTRKPSEQTLTPDQERWHAAWAGYPVYVITDVSEVYQFAGLRGCDEA
jgi:hypothetical protein